MIVLVCLGLLRWCWRSGCWLGRVQVTRPLLGRASRCLDLRRFSMWSRLRLILCTWGGLAEVTSSQSEVFDEAGGALRLSSDSVVEVEAGATTRIQIDRFSDVTIPVGERVEDKPIFNNADPRPSLAKNFLTSCIQTVAQLTDSALDLGEWDDGINPAAYLFAYKYCVRALVDKYSPPGGDSRGLLCRRQDRTDRTRLLRARGRHRRLRR